MMLINEYMKYYKVINFSAVWSGRHYHKLNGQMVSFHLLFIKLQYLQEKKGSAWQHAKQGHPQHAHAKH